MVVEDSNVNPAGNITAGGTITFNDVDLTDTHAAVLRAGIVDVERATSGLCGQLDLVSELRADADQRGSGGPESSGSLGWTFTLDDGDPILQSLADGQTITQVYRITVSDGQAGRSPRT